MFGQLLKNKNNLIFITIVVLLIILYLLNTTEASKPSSVYTASTREKFGNELLDTPNNTSKIQFTVFYTNWCGWSKKFLATLDSQEFKDKFKEVENKAEVIRVDCENDKEKCGLNKIEGYPTIKLFKSESNVIDFNGDRTPDGIVKFIKENL